MEHAEAREILEDAAVEPGGFERLAAGDTPGAALLAGHLAGCPDCAAEMERLHRSAGMIRETVRVLAPPDLRDRTLAFVAAVGRPRGAGVESIGSAGPSAAGPSAVAGPSIAATGRTTDRPSDGVRRIGLWAASIAAAVAVAIVGTAAFVGADRDARLDHQQQEIASLAKLATWTLRIDGQPDARYVRLTGPSDTQASGTLIFSPGSHEIVVVASGLPEPAPGSEYRCWIEVGGHRSRIGPMFFGGDVAYWVGAADTVAVGTAGVTFGVSLVPASGDSISTEPVLVGES